MTFNRVRRLDAGSTPRRADPPVVPSGGESGASDQSPGSMDPGTCSGACSAPSSQPSGCSPAAAAVPRSHRHRRRRPRHPRAATSSSTTAQTTQATTTSSTSTATAPTASPRAGRSPTATWPGTRDVQSSITSSNVTKLGVAWTVPITGKAGAFGNFATTPVVVNGVVYVQDLDSGVYAIKMSTGKLLWHTSFTRANVGPNGVNVVGGKVYGATDHERVRAERGDRRAAVVQEAHPQRGRGHRHGPGDQRRHRLRLDRARATPRASTSATASRSCGRWTPPPAR